MKQATKDPIAMAYHELRSPLGLMVTAAHALALEVEDEAVQIRCDAIVRAAERMLRTASQVLSPAKTPESGAGGTFQAWNVVSELAEDFKELGLPIELSSTTLATETVVAGTDSEFEALVSSLLMNARDHQEPGTPIRLVCAANDDAFTVEISNEIASRDSHEGLSMGTSIAAGLAKRLGAVLESESDHSTYLVRISIPTVQ